MTGEPGITEQLDSLVSGKRRSRRRAVSFPALIKAVEREFRAIACDISEGGVLLELSHQELAGESEPALGPAQQLALVETHFRENFDVHFPQHDAVAEAILVRLSVRPEQPLSVYLGCQFVHPLGEGMSRRLGLLAEHPEVAAWDDVEQLRDLPWRNDPRRPTYLMVFDDTEDVVGPSFMGKLTALGKTTVVFSVEETDCESVTALLAGKALQVRIMRGQNAIWAAQATLLATRYLDGLRQGAEVALTTEPGPSRKIRKLFRKA